MKNYAFVKENIDDITLDYFKMVAITCMDAGINSIAPLGFSGDDFYLHGRFIPSEESKDGRWHRESVVSLRNYCGDLQMLVTDKNGRFLVYSTVDCLSIDGVIEELYREFQTVKHLVNSEAEKTFENGTKKADCEMVKSVGFEMLMAYYEKLKGEGE